MKRWLVFFLFLFCVAIASDARVRGIMLGMRHTFPMTNDLVPASGWTNEYYIATNGSYANSGTNLNAPKPEFWSWTNPPIANGATIWALPGDYNLGVGRSNFTSGQGPDSYVTIRNYTNGRVRFYTTNNVLMVAQYGKWSRHWGILFECPAREGFIESASVNNKPRATGYSDAGFSNQIIHCTFRGFADSVSAFQNTTGWLYYGNITVGGGWMARVTNLINLTTNEEGTGYSLYFHSDNDFDAVKTVEDNLFGPGMAPTTYNYSQSTNLYNISIKGNSYWSAGTLSTNHRAAANFRSGTDNNNNGEPTLGTGVQGNYEFRDNIFYHDITRSDEGFSENINLMAAFFKASNCFNLFLTNNVIIGGREPLQIWNWTTNVRMWSNTILGQVNMLIAGEFDSGCSINRNRYYWDFRTVPFFYPATFIINSPAGNFNAYLFGEYTNAFGFDIDTQTNWVGEYSSEIITNVNWRPSRFEAKRGNLFIANNNTNHNVLVTVTPTFDVGEVVKIRNVMNLDATHALRTVDGSGRISVPMTNMVNMEAWQTYQATGLPYTWDPVSTNGMCGGFVVTLENSFF